MPDRNRHAETPMIALFPLPAWIVMPLLFVSPVPAGDCPCKAGALTSAIYSVAELVVPIGVPKDGQVRTTERELIRQVCTHMAPASWASAGGEGVIEFRADSLSLLVRQTPGVHADL